MTTRNLVILMICASSIAICANNNAAVRGPVTGYIFDAQAHAIRPMMGIPGAAYPGSPVVSNVDSASVSPDGSAAFAIQAGKLVVYTGLASILIRKFGGMVTYCVAAVTAPIWSSP